MAEETKAEEVAAELRDAFALRIRDAAPDLPAHQALQLADALCVVQTDVLAGRRVTYRARPPIDGEAITEDWRRGKSLDEIMRDHRCSRTTAYRLHPSKLTRKRA